MSDLGRMAAVMACVAAAAAPAQMAAPDTSVAVAEDAAPLSQIARPIPTGLTCLKRRVTNNGGEPFTFVGIAASADVGKLAGKGLAVATCRVSPAMMASYQKMVCDMVTQGNDAVQNRLEQVLGAKPRDLCVSARKVAPLMGVAVVGNPLKLD